MKEGHDDSGVLPNDHPHIQLYRDVTPIWHDGKSPDEDLDWRYSCGFSTGFVRGIVMAVMKPEWAVGWNQRVRRYYLTHNHPPEDLESWQRYVEETVLAIPIHRLSPEPRPADSQASTASNEPLQGFPPSAAPMGVEETV